MRRSFLDRLRCPACQGPYALDAIALVDGDVREGILECRCGTTAPIIGGVPRILPGEAAATLPGEHPDFFDRHPDLAQASEPAHSSASTRTLRAFGDEWRRFPEILAVHKRLFDWYFEGPDAVEWGASKVLDAGCGMGRWLHFACQAGADIVGMDVSPAIDVAASREGAKADFVQADLLEPPFAPGSFDLVYCFGVVHHLEDAASGVRALARLVRPGGELRLYVYRSLAEEPVWKRSLLWLVTQLRRLTTRLPYWAVHSLAILVGLLASFLVIWPRRLLRRGSWAERQTRHLPLAQYTDVPFPMLVAEQFDRLVAPIEGRYTREDVVGWFDDVGLDVVAVLPDLGWRAIGRRPAAH